MSFPRWSRPATTWSRLSGPRRRGRGVRRPRPGDHPRVTARLGDVTQPDTLPPALAGVDAIIHLVAIPRDFNGGRDLAQINTEGTRNVVRAAEAAGVRRLIHLGAMGVADDPRLHYARSKARARRSSAAAHSTGRS